MPNSILNKMKDSMNNTIEAAKEDLKSIRTGRANPGLLSRVQVEYYGSFVPLQQLGTTTVLDGSTLQIQAFDKSSVGAIEKSLSISNLGVTTSSEGQLIRVSIPPLTQERRDEYLKLAKAKGEDIKIQIRNHRHDAKNKISAMKKAKEISEDDERGFDKKIDSATKEFTDTVEQLVNDKLEELKKF